MAMVVMLLLDDREGGVAASRGLRVPDGAFEVSQAGVSCRGPARPPRSGGQPGTSTGAGRWRCASSEEGLWTTRGPH
jgi:hypothetical protein